MHNKQSKDRFARAKERMLKWHLRDRDIVDPVVLAAMEEIPREEFVPQSYQT